MGLTGGPFVVLVALLAAAAVVACVRLLPRVGDGTPRQVLLRAGLMTGTQLVLVTAILVMVNSSFVFFASWSDLLGTDNSQANVVGGSAHAAMSPVSPAASIRPARDALSRSVPPNDGRLDSIVIRGPRTGLSAASFVYLPPQYSQPAYRNRRFPVVLVLTPDVRALMTRLRLPAVVAGRIAAGSVQPTVYVMVSPAGCVDVPGGRQDETFLSQDVPVAVAARYRVARDGRGWGVLGDSAGGYCAAKLVLGHSDRFTAGASAAAAYNAPAGDLYGRSTAIRDENDLVWRLRHRPSPPADLLTITGGGNEAQAREFAALIRPPMRGGTLKLTGGGALPTWQRDLPAVLTWLNQRLSAES
ncbi:MAG: putative esterase [Actinoallomurus sp.]|nr:putative esterase [Actinoallomurus sp.]